MVETGSLNSKSKFASEPVNREEGPGFTVSAVATLVERSIPEFSHSEGYQSGGVFVCG